jgi:ubiquinone/menaquinone biosynthesis C-methylase UbiE
MMQSSLTQEISQYWNQHIHDLAIAKHPVGTKEFFIELDEYRFDKLRYLPQVVDFGAYRGKNLLEIGCGAGIDLVRFAKAGAQVTGVDLSQTAIDLAEKNLSQNSLHGTLQVMDGENLEYPDASFDVVYAHGVLQYTGNPEKMVQETYRVLKKGGEGIFMVYNRISWLNLMRQVTKVELEHEDAPILRKYSIAEFKKLLRPFQSVRIVVERFPVKSRLHGGLKGILYNTLFVGAFNAVPKCIVRPFGWHIMAFVNK